MNGVACEAVVDQEGQADEQEDGADGDLVGHNVNDWDGVDEGMVFE